MEAGVTTAEFPRRLAKAFRMATTAICLAQAVIFPMAVAVWYCVFLPVKWANRKFFNSMLTLLTATCTATWSYSIDLAGHSVYECGDDFETITKTPGVVLLMTNHQSLVDIFTAARFLQSRPELSRIIWMIEWILQFTPMGPALLQHGDFFMLERSDVKTFRKFLPFDFERILTQQPEALRRCVLEGVVNNDRKVISIFPEGGLLYKRKAGGHRFARANNLPILQHVAFPRMGAISNILRTLGPADNPKHRVKWILDATVAYEKIPRTLQDYFLLGNERLKTVVHFKLIPIEELTGSSEGEFDPDTFQKNIFDLYIAKEKLLDHFVRHGEFPLSDTQRCATPCAPVNVGAIAFGNILAISTCYCFCVFVKRALELLLFG